MGRGEEKVHMSIMLPDGSSRGGMPLYALHLIRVFSSQERK